MTAAFAEWPGDDGRPGPDPDLLRRAWDVRARHFPPVIGFTRPARTMPVSVTGRACALDCAHCGGRYLAGMVPLERALEEFSARRARSFLVSGGCDPEGRVPLAPHLDRLRALARAGRLNVHTGLVDGEDEAARLAGLADTVSFDLVADDAAVRDVFGLRRTAGDFLRSYTLLRRYVRVVPHVLIGLAGGAIRGEAGALAALVEAPPPALVFLVFRPTRGTRFEGRRPPPLRDVVELMARARIMLPRVPIFLGCMRPGGRYREALDRLAVAAGVNRVVQPAPAARETARSLGLAMETGEECCVL